MSLYIAKVGPVVLINAGDQFIDACRIAAIIWEGATVSGDTVELRNRVVNTLLWSGRTSLTQTYQGINFGPHGEHCPDGFYLAQISAGRILVYLSQA